MQLSALKSLKKPGAPPAKLKPHQKLLRSVQRISHTILNGSSKALSKAVIFLAAIEVRRARRVLVPLAVARPVVPPAAKNQLASSSFFPAGLTRLI